MFRIARSKLIQTISSVRSVITIYLSVHVRWPARPAELRAGLDFFFVILSDYLFASGQKENESKTILLSSFDFYAEITTNFFFLNILSFACAKESNKPACR